MLICFILSDFTLFLMIQWNKKNCSSFHAFIKNIHNLNNRSVVTFHQQPSNQYFQVVVLGFVRFGSRLVRKGTNWNSRRLKWVVKFNKPHRTTSHLGQTACLQPGGGLATGNWPHPSVFQNANRSESQGSNFFSCLCTFGNISFHVLPPLHYCQNNCANSDKPFAFWPWCSCVRSMCIYAKKENWLKFSFNSIHLDFKYTFYIVIHRKNLSHVFSKILSWNLIPLRSTRRLQSTQNIWKLQNIHMMMDHFAIICRMMWLCTRKIQGLQENQAGSKWANCWSAANTEDNDSVVFLLNLSRLIHSNAVPWRELCLCTWPSWGRSIFSPLLLCLLRRASSWSLPSGVSQREIPADV